MIYRSRDMAQCSGCKWIVNGNLWKVS